MSPTSIAAYLVLFGSVGLLFLMVSLLLGKLLRPAVPTPSKLEPYECGEPAVGTSFVQFDLRFYVVALVFIVFEVEVALFFPPATIFGSATRWMKPPAHASGSLRADVGVALKQRPPPPVSETAVGMLLSRFWTPRMPGNWLLAAAADLAAFFALILLGFAYVWRRGDLNWVRAIDSSQSRQSQNLV